MHWGTKCRQSPSITLVANFFPARERTEAENFCKAKNIPHVEIHYDEVESPGIRQNPVDRCYHCKKKLFDMIKEEAAKHGIDHICEGSNMDDKGVCSKQILQILLTFQPLWY